MYLYTKIMVPRISKELTNELKTVLGVHHDALELLQNVKILVKFKQNTPRLWLN